MSFVERTDSGIDWFAVRLPKTAYCHPSEALGKAYAFELIDGLRNPDGDVGPIHMGIVLSALGRWTKGCDHIGMSSFLHGFGHVLGELRCFGGALCVERTHRLGLRAPRLLQARPHAHQQAQHQGG